MMAGKQYSLTLSLLTLIIIGLSGCGSDEYTYDEEIGDSPKALIPAGEFDMGDAFNEGHHDERPVHTVHLDAFYMDVFEVTNARYARFLNEYGKLTDSAGHVLIDFGKSKIGKKGNTFRPKSGYGNHPVVYVSWYGAAVYAQFYGKRLPTEAEWEKAARGGLVGKRFVWGDSWPPPKGSGNFADETLKKKPPSYGWSTINGYDDGYAETAPVGSFNPNGYGLYDIAGNVEEWCADEYDENYYSVSPKNNPEGPGTPVSFTDNDFTNVSIDVPRVYRDDSWYFYIEFDGGLRVARRFGCEPRGMSCALGFRCAGF